MPPKRKLGKRLLRSLLPIVLVILVAVLAALSGFVLWVSRPEKNAYHVTPQSFLQTSGLALKVTDETWTNRDGSLARGWLLKGAEGAPAVVLLHRYGADRSYALNLGIKINEATRFTILWPDMRGHGLNPPVSWTSFSGQEDDDLLAALDFLRSLKSAGTNKLVGNRFGVYGVELGAYTALKAGQRDSQIKVLALDSVPRSSTELLDAAITNRTGIDNSLFRYLTRSALRVYLMESYRPTSACEIAASLREQRIMLLSGADAGYLIASTASIKDCFPSPANVGIRTDLPLSGLNLLSATGEQGESYDRIVIDFFDKYLR